MFSNIWNMTAEYTTCNYLIQYLHPTLRTTSYNNKIPTFIANYVRIMDEFTTFCIIYHDTATVFVQDISVYHCIYIRPSFKVLYCIQCHILIARFEC